MALRSTFGARPRIFKEFLAYNKSRIPTKSEELDPFLFGHLIDKRSLMQLL